MPEREPFYRWLLTFIADHPLEILAFVLVLGLVTGFLTTDKAKELVEMLRELLRPAAG